MHLPSLLWLGENHSRSYLFQQRPDHGKYNSQAFGIFSSDYLFENFPFQISMPIIFINDFLSYHGKFIRYFKIDLR